MKSQASKISDVGDVCWVNANTAAGRELKNRRRFIVITPHRTNALGVTMMVAVARGDQGAPIRGNDTAGVAARTQVRSFDLRTLECDARYIETLDGIRTSGIVRKVASIIDSEPE